MRLEERSLLYDIRESCDLIAQFTEGKDYAHYVAPGATVDGLHLSNRGHEILAERLRACFVATH
ncbi:MAG TPA: hypothetical protein PLO37_23610 [Candidatus Hydrogenedentes bacterium]|nr:hypothetical protein [Candidatus Hydrogenedentota bacterium]HPG69848.1 hypothetical protein [Candidatus Hydrogenedentota bacterium]